MATAPSGSVRVGVYSLDVGSRSGSFAQYEPEDERKNASALASALDTEGDDRPKPVAAIEEFQESADAVTGKVEQADQLLKAAAAGQLLDLSNVNSEIDALLDLFGRLDRAGRFEEELRLMRSLDGLLALALRWLDLIRSLRSLLSSAQAAGHAGGQAFAQHELGSLYLCAGRPTEAVEHLREADRLQDRLADLSGHCATRHNLDSAERDLARRAAGGSQRPTRLQRLLVLMGAVAVAAAGGAGIALAVHHRHGSPPTPTSTQPGAHMVAVLLAGSGGGSVHGRGLTCGNDCSTSVAEGDAITLTATHAIGSVFTGWSGVDHCDRSATCKLTVRSPVTVTATFTARSQTTTQTQPQAVPTPTGLRATVVSPTEIDIFWRDPPAIGYFVIYRNSQKLAPVFGNTTSYHDTDLAPSTKYTYTVQALAADGQASAQSAPQSATTPPSAPTNLVATVQSGGDIALTWTASPDSAVAGYTIYRGTDATVVPTTQVMTVDGRTSTKFTDPNPNPNLSTTYYYAVKATGRAGTSGASNVAYATTPAG